MARTAADLKTESLLGFDTTTYGSYVDNWLKDALEEIAVRAGGSQTPISTASVAFTSGTPTGTLATDHFIYPYGVQYRDSSGNVTVMEEVAYVELLSLPTSNSTTPTVFAMDGQTMTVWPTPSANLTVTVYYLAVQGTAFATTAALGTAPYLQDWWADAIVCYVRAKLFRYEDDFEMSGQWEGAYERNLAKVASEYGRKITPRQVPGTWALERRYQ